MSIRVGRCFNARYNRTFNHSRQYCVSHDVPAKLPIGIVEAAEQQRYWKHERTMKRVAENKGQRWPRNNAAVSHVAARATGDLQYSKAHNAGTAAHEPVL